MATKILGKNTSSAQIANFLSNSELKQIIDFYNSLPVSTEYSSPKNQRRLMHYDNSDYPLMKSIIEPKLQSLFPGCTVVNSTFTNWTTPVEVHTDSWQPNEDQESQELGYAVLIPLEIDPNNHIASTIVFDQYCEGPTNTLENIQSNEAWNIAEYSDRTVIENLQEDKLDIETYNQLLSHCDYKPIENFSIQGLYNWFPGSAIVWHRKYYHCSTSFTDINSKLHAIFLINF